MGRSTQDTRRAGRAQAAERAMSLRPRDLVPADALDVIDALHTFTLSPNREHKAGPMLSRTVRQALEIIVRAEHVSIVQVFCCAVSSGLARINALPDAREVVRVFGVLIDRGANIALLDSWSYSPDREGMRRLSMHNIPPSLSGQCADLATALGLSASTVYGLAIRAGLAGVALPGDVADQLHDDVMEFRAALKKRANYARRIAASVQQPTQRVRYEWD
jgi:hypothetical protein